ncbi:MAG: HD domain-containing phosphohydrolase [Bacillota bacterium]
MRSKGLPREVLREGLQQVQQSMARALGIWLEFVGPNGEYITEVSNMSGLCAMLHHVAACGAKCDSLHKEYALAAASAGEVVTRRCYAGLTCVAVPVRLSGEVVAVAVGGGIVTGEGYDGDLEALTRETGLDPEGLREASTRAPRMAHEKLRMVMGMVQEVSGTVVQLLRAKHEYEGRENQLRALLEFGKNVSSSLDVAEVARRALESVLSLTGASSGSVMMLSEDLTGTRLSELAASVSSPGEGDVVPSGELVAVVGERSCPVRFDSRPDGPTPEERKPGVALPLVVGGRVTGVMTLAGKPGGASFADDEVDFLGTLGTSLGLALENARLFRTLESRAAMLERLIDVGRLVSRSLDKETVVRSALESVRDVLGAERCALYLVDEVTGELVLQGSLGLQRPGSLATRVKARGGIIAKVMGAAEPVVIMDLTGEEVKPIARSAGEAQGLALVPVRAGGKVLGILVASCATPRQWSKEELGYLLIVANQAGLALENARLYSSLRDYYFSAVQSLATALEAKDMYTRGHSQRVALWARACAKQLGLSAEEQEQVFIAGLLHDVGKIGVREAVLQKRGALDGQERREMQQHPVIGSRILEPAKFPPPVVAAVKHHHEDYGGGGYPEGIAGENIPLLARIIRVADAYDAMTSARPYRAAMDPAKARQELVAGSGKQFDPRVVEAFLNIDPEEMWRIGAMRWPSQ